ncbi:hypothetical protein H6G54_29250 [Anabaena cylindrica FACHB-243]|uniref:Uncharacterized protein n=1 Tax=Anabaena cylindrica (strain ATCC 27899 / PCC 7122) TaxID=272123 RepID=K9ZS96_ANACC|nr:MULTISPECIES: hypothetical protein [Anabaena]AFZ61215.1 hypothetical protein Anacy_5931 [Anabaena cylindrica PCC 7122]MBD2421691.1 hypothetical protein [Anabaena cylindrica FACHB-243]MBY5280552.1 hypothetical protein [Anabaena sp. CCAP 1446/1C]MBY5308141.1 hypothetical protein [Anabaena sp. CCAP 1446/1C]MCM2405406.1 hypothetical protein [Anabaena sp. CCAP 1446/1C]
MKIRQKLNQKLTSISDSQIPFIKFWRRFVDFLYREPEPEVWERRDRHGNIWWSAYDPATGQSAYLASEQEVMIWIEQIYYQKTLGSHKQRW